MRYALIILVIAVICVALLDAKPKSKKPKNKDKKLKAPAPTSETPAPGSSDDSASNPTPNDPQPNPESDQQPNPGSDQSLNPEPDQPNPESDQQPNPGSDQPPQPEPEQPPQPEPEQPQPEPEQPPVPNPDAPENPDAPSNSSIPTPPPLPPAPKPHPIVISPKEYVLTDIKDLKEALTHLNITVGDLQVPAGVTLDFNLLKGATLTFKGNVTFGFKAWEGPLVRVGGKNVQVFGAPGNVLDGDGKRWWDGKGGNGGIDKPKFLFIRLKNSTVSGLNFKNSPVHGISINSCVNVSVSNIVFDNREGAYKKGGHNTDAFDVGSSDNISIKNCVVYNQDDCLAVNSGTNIVFENNFCSGGHGISIGSVGGRKMNLVANVTIWNNTVADSDNGIRVKTVSNATGLVSNITFEDITLKDIRSVGIRIQGNYLNGGPKGDPTPGVPITGLTMKNINGNVLPGGANYLVWVANATNWLLDSKLSGGLKTKECKGFPDGVQPLC